MPILESIFQMLQEHREKLLYIARHNKDFELSELVFPSLTGKPINPSNLRRSYYAAIAKAGSNEARRESEQGRYQKWRILSTNELISVHTSNGLAAPTGWLTWERGAWHVYTEPLLPELPPIRFHNLRKCAATYITQSLVDAGRYAPKLVAQILGHSSPRVAMEVYQKVVHDDLKLATFDPLKQRREITKILPKKVVNRSKTGAEKVGMIKPVEDEKA